ncbi:TetR/AcrR family transcriptional regulator [Nonomuraea sp. NPDC050536]|uniref:TetR/AcrR family transcriptional regulator n=1 Tax=Nonomuraea sp. NPDC050536 TaxID=3364366 RepID=UPI0037C5C3F2
MTEDRRVRRTRRILRDAFTALVLEKGYDRITVQDILDRADVGRSTFYAHFRDKDALLMACFDGVREDLQNEFASAETGPEGPAATLFRHAGRHRQIYRALCGHRGGELVHRHLKRLIADAVRDHLAPGDPDLPADAVAAFYASATVGLLQWWVDHDFAGGATRMAAAHHRLTSTAFTGI